MGGHPTHPVEQARQPAGTRRHHQRLAGVPGVPEGDLPPLIFAADLVRASHALHPDPLTLGEIAGVLGLVEAEPTMVFEPAVAPDIAAPVTPSEAVAAPAAATPAVRAAPVTVVSTITPLASGGTADRPAWFAATTALEPPSPTPTPAATPMEPLFLPRWTRAIASGAMSVRSEEGPLDVVRIVERLARLVPLGILPRLPWPTTRFGAQVLVDVGDGMEPFARDVPHLLDAIEAVVGGERVPVRRFVGTPGRGAGTGPRTTWTRYELPAAPMPVALVTDLGIGRPLSFPGRATTAEWLAFAEAARRGGTPLIAFVPYPLGRVPAVLRRAMAVISWDRPTSSRDVHRAVGRGLRVAQP